MPYANEHACRLKTPSGRKTRRVNNDRKHDGKRIDVIYQQKPDDDAWEEQAYRYPKDDWTESAARSHCTDHDGQSFEPASDEDSHMPHKSRELRHIPFARAEIRLHVEGDDDSQERRLKGYGAVVNVWSEDLGGFVERIASGAFDGAIDDPVVGLFNHNPDKLLARTPDTMKLKENDTGLLYDMLLGTDEVARFVAEKVQRRDLTGSSFAFIIAEDGDTWEKGDDGIVKRTITNIERVFDVGPVTFPAYEATSVSARSMEAALNFMESATGPIGPDDAAKIELLERRIRFYERHGVA